MEQLPLEPVGLMNLEVNADALPPFRFDQGDLEGLMRSIEDFGLLVPPVVWHTKDSGKDRWVVIDGSRRIAALNAIQVERETEHRAFPFNVITVAVFRGTLEQAKRLSVILHLCVAQNNRGDEAVAS